MRFFVPAAKDDAHGRDVLASVREFTSAGPNAKPLWKLSWQHNSQQMHAEVGQPLPSYYGTGKEPVVCIPDCGAVLMICTPNRGVIRGQPVPAGAGVATVSTMFDV